MNNAALFLALAIGLASCSPQPAKKAYILAEKLWQEERYPAAALEFERVVRLDPDGKLGSQALYRLGMTQTLFLDQQVGAIRTFREFIRKNPEENAEGVWSSKVQIGEILFEKLKRYDEAIDHYSGLLNERPSAAEADEFQYRIAKGYFYLWKFDEAIQAFQSLMEKSTSLDWKERAEFEVIITKFTAAEQKPENKRDAIYLDLADQFRKFLAQHPRSPYASQAKFHVAACLEEMDQLDQAYELYHALEDSYPSPNVIKIKLARIRERINRKSRP